MTAIAPLHETPPTRRGSRVLNTPLVLGALGVVVCGIAWLGVVGSDALWLSALGDAIREGRTVPRGIPFAAADSQQWVNTTVLGQLLFSFITEMGSVGVALAQLVAAAVALGILAAGSLSQGASSTHTALAILVVAAGAAAPLLVARAQLLSLVPFALLLALVRRQQVQPDRHIWWAVPLLVLWGNLHGAVLVGVAVLGCYIAFSRLRSTPLTAVGVGASALVATCLNPGLTRAPEYYLGVLGGEATSDPSGMWGRLNLSNPFDLLLVVAMVALALVTLRRRQPLWEYVALVGLVVATGSAARNGIWLLLLVLTPAALGASNTRAVAGPHESAGRVSRLIAPTALAVTVLALAASLVATRIPDFQADDRAAADLAAATRGEVVLVAEPLAESIAAAKGLVWVSNPLDAFAAAHQDAYLGFMSGDATRASESLRRADVVVATPGSAQARLASDAGFQLSERVGEYVLLRRS